MTPAEEAKERVEKVISSRKRVRRKKKAIPKDPKASPKDWFYWAIMEDVQLKILKYGTPDEQKVIQGFFDHEMINCLKPFKIRRERVKESISRKEWISRKNKVKLRKAS